MRFLDFADQFGGKPATLAVFSTFQFDPDFSIRGLHFDCYQGVLMKLDFVYNININTVYLGREQLQPHQVIKRYPGLHVRSNVICYRSDMLLAQEAICGDQSEAYLGPVWSL